MRYLTKSIFVHSLDCPTKAYYMINKDIYQNTQDDNGFLEALADGGIQVGELARHYYPGGHLIEYDKDKNISLSQTMSLLSKESVIIYEAAISYKNCYSLVDILVKEGNTIKLIEVKSKSWEYGESFRDEKGFISTGWQKYLYDVAFQTWIAKKSFKDFNIEPYLMLVDKNQSSTVDGLHQYFEIVKVDGRSNLRLTTEPKDMELGEPILTQVNVCEEVNQILEGNGRQNPTISLEYMGFDYWVEELGRLIENNDRISQPISKTCKSCEYRIKSSDLISGKKCGFNECWSKELGWDHEDLSKPLIFDIWNERGTQKLLDSGIYHVQELEPEYYDVNYHTISDRDHFSINDRKSLQIMKTTGRDASSEIILPGLFDEMENWKYPLHFIDFEGVSPAIPFHKGMKPYKKTPFQFSIHNVYENGDVKHVSEWVEREPGVFPCFTFIRELKKVLDQDQGSVFMYHHYERTTLRDVKGMLEDSSESDKEELINFIDTLIEDESNRCLIDQQKLVLKYYYSSFMGNSNSIKDVLPAVLNESDFLKKEYSRPYSGLTIKDKILYVEKDGLVINPYKLLDPLDLDTKPNLYIDNEIIEAEKINESVADGGKAMMEWSRMQFPGITTEERDSVFKGLLSYCELDTLAMVMIFQHWKSLNK